MSSHPVYRDDDYHESVSNHVPADWATTTGTTTRMGPSFNSPFSSSSRPYSVFTTKSLTSPHRRRMESPARRTSSCLVVTMVVIGTISVLSILAAVFIATIGLNNLSSQN